MQGSGFIIIGLILFVLISQGLAFFIFRHFAGRDRKRVAAKFKALVNETRTEIGSIKKNVEDCVHQLHETAEKNCKCSEPQDSPTESKPFGFMRRCDPAQLLNIMQQEHPQTIALVLSYMEPAQAAIILRNLPQQMQSDVLQRIACMDRANPQMVRAVERVLEQHLSSCADVHYSGGVESAVEILNSVNRATEKQVIEALEDEDPELAEEIIKRMFVFEDIVMLDDRAIQKVMREVDSQELAKALKSVDAEVQDKIFKNMSMRAAGMLKEDMEYMGPVRLKDVEEAQERIVAIIRRLEETGEIIVARSGEDEIIV